MHFEHPVAKAIHYQFEHLGMADVQGIPGAGVIHVITAVIGQAIVGGVIDSTEADGRAHLIALGRVVIDDVKDHFDIGAQ